VSNSEVVDFGDAAGGATVDHAAIYDSASGGELLAHGALANSNTISGGDPVSFDISSLSFTVA